MKTMTNIAKFERLQLLYQLKCDYHKREITTTFDNARSALGGKGYLKDVTNLGATVYSFYNKIKSGKK